MLLALPLCHTAQRAQQQYRQHKARVLTLGLAGPRTGRLARCHSHSQSSSDKTMHSHTLAQTHPHLEWPPQDQQHKLSPQQQQQPSRSESLKETYLQERGGAKSEMCTLRALVKSLRRSMFHVYRSMMVNPVPFTSTRNSVTLIHQRKRAQQ